MRRNKTDRHDPPDRAAGGGSEESSSSSPAMAVHANYHSFSDSGSVHHGSNDPLATTTTTTANTAATLCATDVTTTTPPTTTSTQYRGFATSASDLFMNEDWERVDCCAVTCCGILQNDRDRFVLQGIAPPSLAKRCIMHVLVPIGLFFTAGMAAIHIRKPVWNQLASTGLILLLAFYFGLQCAKGRWKRMEIRKDLLYAKYQVLVHGHEFHNAVVEHHRPYDDDVEEEDSRVPSRQQGLNGTRRPRGTFYYQGQSPSDLRQAHPCCLIGCYADDRPLSSPSSSNEPATIESEPNLARCVYETLCPLSLCGHHVQLCGICAIAQEARDVETVVVPRNYTRIDYITMEHVSNYYPAIYRHRWWSPYHHDASNTTTMASRSITGNPEHPLHTSTTTAQILSTKHQHHKYTLFGHPLSQLSHQLIQSLLWFCACMLLWCVLGPYYWRHIAGRRGNPHMFRYQNFLMLILTLGQSIVFLALWTWMLAGCSFSCCGSKRQQQGQRQRRRLPLEFSMDARIKYFASGFFLSASLAMFWECVAAMVVEAFTSLLLAALGVDVMDSPETERTRSQTAAAGWGWLMDMVPRTVITNRRHPTPWSMAHSLWTDSANNNDMDAANLTGHADYAEVFGLDHPIFYTFYIFIATFAVAAFIEEVCKYFGYRMVEHPDFYSRTEIEQATSGLEAHRHIEDDDDDDDYPVDEELPEAPSSVLLMDYSQQNQSMQNRGAAITLAMVSTAIGFACCENLMYIFLYAGQSFHSQLGVLIARSFFPIHPVLAAIQSIGVCRRDLEGSTSTKLGRIIFPAVCFHGLFDFLIVFLSFVGRLVGQNYEEGDLRVSNTTEFVSVLTCVWVMCGAIFYAYNELGKQRERLAVLDQQPGMMMSASLPVDGGTLA